MKELFGHIFEFVAGILQPRQTVIVAGAIAALLLFNPLGWVEKAGISEDTNAFRFAAWLIFLFSFFTVLLWIGQFFLDYLQSLRQFFARRSEIRALQTHPGACTILFFLEGKRPDPVQLLPRHPDVIFLRKNNLIMLHSTVYLSEFENYELTRLGVYAANSVDDKRLNQIPEGDVVEFLRQVTGLDVTPNYFRRL